MMKISFPRLAHYHIPIKGFLQSLFPQADIILPPAFTKKTLELGARHSPDFVCAPFKYNLGNFIEVLELGANVLMQAGGGCRFGFYGTLQEKILRDLGYDFIFVKMVDDTGRPSLKALQRGIKELGGRSGYPRLIYELLLALKKINLMDEAEFYAREHETYEIQKGELKKNLTRLYREVAEVRGFSGLRSLKRTFWQGMSDIPVENMNNALRIGIIGELYDVMEPFANRYIEKELLRYGVSITRPMNASRLLFQKKSYEPQTVKSAMPYVKYHLGADGTFSVAKALEFAKKEYDGIIHIKPFGCTPEINAIPMLQRIGQDYKIPILYLTFDTLTSETGLKTRIEAFIDMLNMRKETKAKEQA